MREIKLWNINEDKPVIVKKEKLDFEKRLEN